MRLNKLLVQIFLLTILHQACSQVPDRFIVDIAQFMQPQLGNATVRCSATLITNRHLLTTAACAMVPYPWLIAIQILTEVESGSSIGR